MRSSPSGGFWTSYLHVLMVRDPLDRYLSWLQYCLPSCKRDLVNAPKFANGTEMDDTAPEFPRLSYAQCFRERVSQYIETLLEPAISRQQFAVRSPWWFGREVSRKDVPGCRKYHLGYPPDIALEKSRYHL